MSDVILFLVAGKTCGKRVIVQIKSGCSLWEAEFYMILNYKNAAVVIADPFFYVNGEDRRIERELNGRAYSPICVPGAIDVVECRTESDAALTCEAVRSIGILIRFYQPSELVVINTSASPLRRVFWLAHCLLEQVISDLFAQESRGEIGKGFVDVAQAISIKILQAGSRHRVTSAHALLVGCPDPRLKVAYKDLFEEIGSVPAVITFAGGAQRLALHGNGNDPEQVCALRDGVLASTVKMGAEERLFTTHTRCASYGDLDDHGQLKQQGDHMQNVVEHFGKGLSEEQLGAYVMHLEQPDGYRGLIKLKLDMFVSMNAIENVMVLD